MAKETEEKQNTGVALRGGKTAGRKQREALHTFLANDDEYKNMEDHVQIDAQLEDSLDDEVKKETRLVSINNIMKLVYLDVQGYGVDAVAKAMALSREDVQSIRRTDAFKAARDAVMVAIVNKSRQMMEVSAMKAVKTLTECMESRNDKVRLSAAVEVLNRTGLTATQKIELTTTNNSMVNLSEEELKEILRSSQAIPAEAEVIPDGK